jgi:hypothetical protein
VTKRGRPPKKPPPEQPHRPHIKLVDGWWRAGELNNGLLHHAEQSVLKKRFQDWEAAYNWVIKENMKRGAVRAPCPYP